MTRIRFVALLPLLLVALFGGARSAAAAPAAPTLVGPASGASVTEPFTLSWSAVAGTVAAYNWEVSTTSSFSAVVANGSTTTATQGTVSGLPNGTYYWHADAYDGSVTGPWSVARTFTITGANANAPSPPT